MSRPAAESALRRIVPGPVEGNRSAVRTYEGGAALRRGAESGRAAQVRPRGAEVKFGLHSLAAADPDTPTRSTGTAGQQVQGQGAPRTVPRAEHGWNGGAPGTDEGTGVRTLRERTLSRRYRLETEVAFPSPWKNSTYLVNLNDNHVHLGLWYKWSNICKSIIASILYFINSVPGLG